MENDRAKIRIYPLSRAAFPGSQSKFEVEVEGAEETSIEVRPCDEASEYEVYVDEKNGSSKTVTITAPVYAEKACLDFYIEAKDASGKIIAEEHAEIIMGPKEMPPTFAITTMIGIGLVVIGLAAGGDTARYSLIAFGFAAFTAAVVASLFGIYGKYIGFPWHFTKEK